MRSAEIERRLHRVSKSSRALYFLSLNLPFRSEACPRIVDEHRFMIMEGATPTFMPDCDVVVISADWCGERLDWCELFGLQDLCWRPPRG